MINKLHLAMIELYSGDAKRIQHFCKVHSYAKLIGESENLDSRSLFILEAAALTHDIGIHTCEEKYGSCGGKLQESPLSRCLCGAACITAAEYVVGCTVNRHFRLRVWDYSHEFGNVQGQICPKYAVLWTLLAAPIMLPK